MALDQETVILCMERMSPMVYDQAASDWQRDAGRWQARAEKAEAALAALRAVGVPTTAEHEAEHRRMDAEFRRAAPGSQPGEQWRVGTSPGTHGRTIYRHTSGGSERGELIGLMDTPEDAARVVEAVNRLLAGEHRQRWEDRLRAEDWTVEVRDADT